MSEGPINDAPRSGIPSDSTTLASRWHDFGAGLCVAGLLLPEAVAYAGLARLPVVHALMALMVGLAVYALFGSSRFAIVAPTSSTATLAAAAVLSIPGTVSPANSLAYTQALLALVLLAGVVLMLLAWARQGSCRRSCRARFCEASRSPWQSPS